MLSRHSNYDTLLEHYLQVEPDPDKYLGFKLSESLAAEYKN